MVITESDGTVAHVHLNMWLHYDNLRQKKNGTFLTANSILAAVAGLSGAEGPWLVPAIAIPGMATCVAWFLLLTRNAAYVSFHRSRVGQDWKPRTRTPSSATLDRTLPVAFGAFWAVALVVSIGLLSPRL